MSNTSCFFINSQVFYIITEHKINVFSNKRNAFSEVLAAILQNF